MLSLQTPSMLLLQHDHQRSDDPDSIRGDNQIAVEATVSGAAVKAISDLSGAIAHADLEAPPAATAITTSVTAITTHLPVTGAFADPPSHELASRVQLCLAFPAHIMLLALLLTLSTSIVLDTSTLVSSIRALCMALKAVSCVILVVGSVSHLARLLLHQDEEKRRLVQEKLRLEERNEQLQAEKERLMYDVQRPGRPLDEEGRSAIRRGLRAGLAPPSEAGGPAPSDSPPPSLPPGAPSSSATDSASGSFRSEEAEGASRLPSWHPPLRRASLGQVLVNEALAEMAMVEQASAEVHSVQPPLIAQHTLRASREQYMPTRILCHHTYPKTDGLQYSLASAHKLVFIPSCTLLVLYDRATTARRLRSNSRT